MLEFHFEHLYIISSLLQFKMKPYFKNQFHITIYLECVEKKESTYFLKNFPCSILFVGKYPRNHRILIRKIISIVYLSHLATSRNFL